MKTQHNVTRHNDTLHNHTQHKFTQLDDTTQQNNTQHNDSQHNNKRLVYSTREEKNIMLKVILPSVIMLGVVAPFVLGCCCIQSYILVPGLILQRQLRL